jgi:hypothetical protein
MIRKSRLRYDSLSRLSLRLIRLWRMRERARVRVGLACTTLTSVLSLEREIVSQCHSEERSDEESAF